MLPKNSTRGRVISDSCYLRNIVKGRRVAAAFFSHKAPWCCPFLHHASRDTFRDALRARPTPLFRWAATPYAKSTPICQALSRLRHILTVSLTLRCLIKTASVKKSLFSKALCRSSIPPVLQTPTAEMLFIRTLKTFFNHNICYRKFNTSRSSKELFFGSKIKRKFSYAN